MNHPCFRNSRVVTDRGVKVLRTHVPTDEKTYAEWQSSIQAQQADGKKYRFLMLPVDASRLEESSCCSKGSAEVLPVRPR